MRMCLRVLAAALVVGALVTLATVPGHAGAAVTLRVSPSIATEPATVIILPVIRIERDPDGSSSEPHSGNSAGRRRRRRVAR